ncbi:uncharacterized protein LOC111699566 [Eurytemora carolleeae]|uniref:uncharacterized protein LOC111699566 n=1 Tax=Eurytemora carolleeae TaxID=1294199 RepID=UPI000C77B9B5|nr:uncharacterized protein LOC111699566 [Eurytemora carolleeae]|eukprot:XP_023326036.1 uncharacterized protein LOC111699566 [Eurytemora affinis]
MKMIIFYLMLILTPVFNVYCDEVEDKQQDLRKQVVFTELIKPSDIRLDDPQFIHLAMIITNVNKKELVPKILTVFSKNFNSILNTLKDTPLHLMLITDETSKPKVENIILQCIGRLLSESVILRSRDGFITFPRFFVEFVNISPIIQQNRETIDVMKTLFSKEETLPLKHEGAVVVISPKYREDLFYIGPFYHTSFPSLNRLMVFDVDLEIKEDLAVLNKQFDTMDSSEVIGVVLDQTGYYFHMSEYITKTNGVSLPQDKILGLNTGVVLFNLEEMRKSELYLEQVQINRIKQLYNHFKVNGWVVGDQEWFNLLMWRYPHLYKVLPCEYNVQSVPVKLDQTMVRCTADIRILHTHGDMHEVKQ